MDNRITTESIPALKLISEFQTADGTQYVVSRKKGATIVSKKETQQLVYGLLGESWSDEQLKDIIFFGDRRFSEGVREGRREIRSGFMELMGARRF